MYSQQHIVKTRWGTFRLDDGAYEAFLAGKLWIDWGAAPGGREAAAKPAKPFIPVNVSDEAVRLRDAAAKRDIWSMLQEMMPGENAHVPYSSRFDDLPVEEMNLSVRSSNALMRSNVRTFGRLKEVILSEGGLRKIRNLGMKSEREIVCSFFSACYYRLSPVEQAVYWQNLISKKGMPDIPPGP